jgi:hydroxymethylglutaryl-CoA synthase
MAGIVSYGAYVPFYRLSRAEIAGAWGMKAATGAGERAVANYDEDSLTMAVAAARDCVQGIDTAKIDGLYFASTTAPYKEKQTAATIAAVLGLPSEAVTIDFSGSLRSGTNALKTAMDAIDSGNQHSILVCAADSRLGYPAGPDEMTFGDGAAAILVGSKELIATIDHYYSRYHEIQDVWRSDRDSYVRTAEDRFASDMGYSKVMADCVSVFLSNTNLAAADFTKVAIYSPNQRQLNRLSRKLGFNDSQVGDVLHAQVGNTGSAMCLMSLVSALEQAGQGERIMLASYGNGCDIFAITTTDSITRPADRRGIKKYLSSKSMLTPYSRYLRWHELIQIQPAARPPIEARRPSPVAQWREVPWELRLTGTKCLQCGTPQYPPQRVCLVCHTKDRFEPYTFFDKPAKVFSFSHDYVVQSVDPPVTVTFVDFEGGGRLMCDMTDRDPATVEVGMPLEMTFRKLYYVDGIYNYWWKCQPARR